MKRTLTEITTFGFGDHTVRAWEWRCIRYGDGSEEQYDREDDRRKPQRSGQAAYG